MARCTIVRNPLTGTVEDIVSFSKMSGAVDRAKEKMRLANITITVKMRAKPCHCKSPAPGTFVEEDMCSCGLSEQHTHCDTCGGVWKE